MAEKITVYEGEYSNRRPDQFRQVNEGVQRLLDVGVSENWLDPEGISNHEKAHIAGHKPGRRGRMVAQVFVNRRNNIEGWRIWHQIDPEENLSMRGKEIVKGCLAPAFVKGRKSTPPSLVDIASAIGGGVIIGLEAMLKIMGAKRDYVEEK